MSAVYVRGLVTMMLAWLQDGLTTQREKCVVRVHDEVWSTACSSRHSIKQT